MKVLKRVYIKIQYLKPMDLKRDNGGLCVSTRPKPRTNEILRAQYTHGPKIES